MVMFQEVISISSTCRIFSPATAQCITPKYSPKIENQLSPIMSTAIANRLPVDTAEYILLGTYSLLCKCTNQHLRSVVVKNVTRQHDEDPAYYLFFGVKSLQFQCSICLPPMMLLEFFVGLNSFFFVLSENPQIKCPLDSSDSKIVKLLEV
jgi:hypothetical protein